MSASTEHARISGRVSEIDMQLAQMDAEWHHSLAMSSSLTNTGRQLGNMMLVLDELADQEQVRNKMRLEYAKIRAERNALQQRLAALSYQVSVEQDAAEQRMAVETAQATHVQEDTLRAREIELEMRKIEAEEAERERDNKLQIELIKQRTAEAQLEAARLAMEASAKAQSETNNSLDALISGIKGDGQAEN